MKQITFKANHAPYRVGEVAHFDDSLAARYIQAGIAEEVVQKTKKTTSEK